tara:strand:- start:167 stop:430 length:264 start_codon:yes stop_codon:yes gene_type:complete
MNKRTGTIKCNQHYYDNEFNQLAELLDIKVISIDRENTNLLVRCESPSFEEHDDYPEYIFNLRSDKGKLSGKGKIIQPGHHYREFEV